MTKVYRLKYGNPVRKMAEAEGYIMARFRGAVPHVIHIDEWRRLMPCDKDGRPLEDAA